MSKIFGIGWAKTGTTTLKTCFETLGYSHYGYNLGLVGMPYTMMAIARRYQTFQDWPWTIYYEELDKEFPGSKFILTMRNSNKWLRSYRNALSKQGSAKHQSISESRKKIYGFDPVSATDQQLIDRYDQHNLNVMNHFYGRPKDFLIVDWERGDGWNKLCTFLGKPVPSKPFPHSNKGKY